MDLNGIRGSQLKIVYTREFIKSMSVLPAFSVIYFEWLRNRLIRILVCGYTRMNYF